GEGLDDLVAFVEHKTARRPAITGCTGELDVSYVARDMNEDGLNLHVVHEVVDLVDLVTALAQGGDGAVGIARIGEANFCRDAHVFSSCAKRKSGPSSVTWRPESRRSLRRQWSRIARNVPTVMPSGTSARRYRTGRQPARYTARGVSLCVH